MARRTRMQAAAAAVLCVLVSVGRPVDAGANCSALGPASALITDPTFNQSECMFAGRIALPASSLPREGALYYTFFAARTLDPAAPLVLWLNGGPGTSSGLGMFYELGPYRLVNGGLVRHELAWTNSFHVLFVDQPLGVGLSTIYSDKDYVTDEDGVATDMLGFLLAWFKMYPQFAANQFFVSGESYAGRFVPSIAHRIWQHNQNASLGAPIRLMGVSVGNGYSAPCEQMPLAPGFASEAGLIDSKQLEVALGLAAAVNAGCESGVKEEAYAAIGAMIEYLELTTGVNRYDLRIRHDYDFSPLTKFLGNATLQLALHLPFPVPYTEKNMSVFWKFSAADQVASMAPKYHDLLDAGIDVLIYHGQYDLTFTSIAEEFWVTRIPWTGQHNFSLAERVLWKGHDPPQPVFGYRKSFQNLHLVTVLNSGHLVPADQPAAALDLIQSFVRKNWSPAST